MFEFRASGNFKLEGLIDTHIHTAPDLKERLLDDIELARAALRERMHAVVIKNHFEPTAGRAALASKHTGMMVLGGVTLNSSVGGLNPEAVRTSAALGGKFVWLPTISRGTVRGDLEGVLGQVAEHNLVLGTGHLKPEEILGVLDLAADSGVKRMVVNHPLTGVVGATLEEQKEMSRRAFLEHCFVACMPEHDGLDFDRIVDAVNYVGHRHCILATDFGQKHNPSPIDGMKEFLWLMNQRGFSHKKLRVMCRDNPLKLIF